ncbi:uncharacterized protein LOC133188033 [Saccostrea echinata]|uniref:uncharacterized protein LOC133188033 n=1 Tax=Saccostrea echinata TaxID=191078 RepID=UPI002A7F9D56|nr:uncharacterized protein LOC133188033 [Saccostrea echinata]
MPGQRRGRGHKGGRSGSRRIRKPNGTIGEHEEIGNDSEIELQDDPVGFFTKNVKFDLHFKEQTENWSLYCAAIRTMEKWKVEVPQHSKVKALAAAWARGDHELAETLLQRKNLFGVVEVSKAVVLLDSGRQARAFEKKHKRLQIQKNNVKPSTMGKLKSDIDNLMKMKPSTGSASGAVCKHVKRWTRTLTKQELEFFALHFPVDLWKRLADICHFHPTKDFSVPWFLPFCFGESPPEDSLVFKSRSITQSNINEILQDHNIPYTKVRSFIAHLTDEIKGKIAQREEKMDTILWYYEELKCPQVDRELDSRLKKGDPVTLALGKLLERILMCRLLQAGEPQNPEEEYEQMRRILQSWDWEGLPEGPGEIMYTPNPDIATFSTKLSDIAQERLANIRLSLDSPVVILGDKSGSMDVAIRTSSIIAGILAVITSAKLVFFDDESHAAPYVPSTVQEVSNLAMEVKAGGGTCPAAALLPFFQRKEVVKTFVIVTDEEEVEKEQTTNMHFAEMFKKYHDEVYPARLLFVSFLPKNSGSEMVGPLQNLGFSPIQFKFDGYRPDLTKLDNLFALQSTHSASFKDDVDKLDKRIESKGIAALFQDDELELCQA